MPKLQPRLLLATSSDDRFPAGSMLDGNEKTFFLTTGMFPQEIIFSFGNDDPAVNLTKIYIISHGIKKVRFERTTDQVLTKFEPMVDVDVNSSGDGNLQRETYQINKATIGQGVRFVKLIIVEGHESFAAVHHVEFEGDHSS